MATAVEAPAAALSPKEAESGSSLASGASSIEQSLEAQVRSEVERYALTDGHLRRLVEERGMGFSPTLARAAIDSLSNEAHRGRQSQTWHDALRDSCDCRRRGRGSACQPEDAHQKLVETGRAPVVETVELTVPAFGGATAFLGHEGEED